MLVAVTASNFLTYLQGMNNMELESVSVADPGFPRGGGANI